MGSKKHDKGQMTKQDYKSDEPDDSGDGSMTDIEKKYIEAHKTMLHKLSGDLNYTNVADVKNMLKTLISE